MVGEFRVTESRSGVRLVVFGPKDKREAEAGVPSVGLALCVSAKISGDAAKLAAFLNASLAASHGDNEPLKAMIAPQ